MNVALDTNAYSDFMRGSPSHLRVVETASHIYLPLFVVGELRAGFVGGNQATKNAASLQRFLNEPGVSMLMPDEQTTHRYVQIFNPLRKQGTPIPASDIWIAAVTIQHNLTLCTSDAHFLHIPQLPRC